MCHLSTYHVSDLYSILILTQFIFDSKFERAFGVKIKILINFSKENWIVLKVLISVL